MALSALFVSPVVMAASNSLTISEAAGVTQTNYPMQIGRPFVQGEIANGAYPQVSLGGTPVPTQVDIKNRWTDGSLKFAVLSFIIPSLPANGLITASINSVSAPSISNTTLTQAQMLGANFDFDATMRLAAGATLTASARAMLQNGDYTVWTAGPIATTIILADHSATRRYDLSFNGGAAAFRPIFEATFWPATNQVHVRYVGENSLTTLLQDYSYSLSLTLGSASPQTVYSNANVNHYASSRWTKDFWTGATPEPQINIDYNLGYVEQTSYVPYYDTSASFNASAVASEYSRWQSKAKDLYDPGFWTLYMPTTGSRADIAPIPEWATEWLYSGDWRMREIVLRQADLAAAWPLNYREGNAALKFDRAGSLPAIGKVISVNAWPNVWIVNNNGVPYFVTGTRITNPALSGGWVPDVAHEPDPFSTAYAMTGDFFYLEQAQLWAATNALNYNLGDVFSYRPAGSGGIYDQVRGDAWAIRTRANAAHLSTDGSAEKSYFTMLIDDALAIWEGAHNITGSPYQNTSFWNWGRTHFMTSTQSPLHFWLLGDNPIPATGNQIGCSPYMGATCGFSEAHWQVSYLLIVLGHMKDQGFPVGPIISWLAPELTGQFSDPQYDPHFVAQYYWNITDPSGAWYPTWHDLAAAAGTGGVSTLADIMAAGFGRSNYYPGLSYAAAATTYGEPGGVTAWNWLKTNVQDAGLTAGLEWNIVPHNYTPPAPAAAAILQSPQNVAVQAGQSAAFFVTYSGNPAPTFQWQSAPGNSVFTNISGATNSAYSIAGALLTDTGKQFRVVLTNSGGTVTSNPGTLTVTSAPPPGTVATPTISPNGGTFGSAPLITLQDSVPNSFIYYTLDGSNPTISSTLYSQPFGLNQSATLKAFATANGQTPSAVASAVFTISIAGTTALPSPNLSGLPPYVSVADSLTASYDSTYNVSFIWSFDPAPSSYAAPVPSVLAHASSANFPTSGPKTAALTSYNLSPGTYRVSVQAVDNANPANRSNPAYATVTLVSADLNSVRIYPNPWRQDKHSSKNVTFDRLPLGSSVKIFSVSGHLVKSLTPTIDTALWDLKNDSGDKVASGLYLYLITTGDTGYGSSGQKLKGKIAVIK